MKLTTKFRYPLSGIGPLAMFGLWLLVGAHTIAMAKGEGTAKGVEVVTRSLTAEDLERRGLAFLAENKKEQGITTTRTGLQYRIIKKGRGLSPKPTDTIKCYYKGMFLNGKVFDQTKKDSPLSFKVEHLIKGFAEALVNMKPGSKWEVFIPSDLAYGKKGTGSTIGPHAVLIFEIELLEVQLDPATKKKIDALIKKLKHNDAKVRTEAAATLGKLGSDAKSAASALSRIRTDKDADVRAAARKALLQIHSDTDAISDFDSLIKNLSSPNAKQRKDAVIILGKISLSGSSKAKKAIAALSKVLKDKDPAVRAAAQQALKKINPAK
jgi:FKBP-type peptidyl-prolyl cis-trans isomerase